ncbi:hypothetical protein [Pararhodobacter aggregans]
MRPAPLAALLTAPALAGARLATGRGGACADRGPWWQARTDAIAPDPLKQVRHGTRIRTPGLPSEKRLRGAQPLFSDGLARL